MNDISYILRHLSILYTIPDRPRIVVRGHYLFLDDDDTEHWWLQDGLLGRLLYIYGSTKGRL